MGDTLVFGHALGPCFADTSVGSRVTNQTDARLARNHAIQNVAIPPAPRNAEIR